SDSRLLHRAGCAVAIAAALAASGCGVTAAISHAVDPAADAAVIARAVARTGQLDGFRYRATLTTAANGVGQQVQMTGAMNTRNGIQAETERIHDGKRVVKLHLLFRGGMTYANLSSFPGLGHQLGSRPWVAFDLYRAEGLPDPSLHYNPAEFIDFLRTPGVKVTPMGAQAVDGVPATLYRADVNLDRYVRAAPRRLRASTRRLVDLVERAVGSHILPEDVWVDSSGLIRQLSWGYTECVAGTSVSSGMLIDFSDFAPQRTTRLPAAKHTRNLTGELTSQFRAALAHAQRLQVGCGTPA
ncbi:MAG: hypothetical protein ACRDL5_02600, partial [Solirubrobacteraceae bacterium]